MVADTVCPPGSEPCGQCNNCRLRGLLHIHESTTCVTKLKRGQRWRRLVDNDRYIIYEILHIFVDLHGRQKLVIQMVPKPPKQIGNLYFRQGGKYPPRVVSPQYLCCFSLIEEASQSARLSSL